MPNPAVIRFAQEADLPIILGFIRSLAKYERLLHEVEASADSLRQHLFGERPAAEVLIAEVDGEAAGFAIFFQNFSTFLGRPGLYLEDLFVDPAFRRRGIGKALLTELARIAVERNYGRLEWSVLDWNAPAIAFYEEVGARVMRDWIPCRVSNDSLRALSAPAGPQ
ncbi:MAG: GNAT family N-acetyltransferase [Opitutales bacterium]|nr:GNAT family N-acetyltransferase [Opitutales bacterium]